MIQATSGEAGFERFILDWGLVPANLTGQAGAVQTGGPPAILTVFTSMFLHADPLHIGGNMLYLWIFGDNVEDRMGHGRYVVFYLLCGWAATFAHIWASPTSTLPSIGASGAIAGVLGAYITLYPHARVVMLLPLGIFTQLLQVPAIFFLGFWFLQQFLFGAFSLGSPDAGGGVAWWAHIGGFVAGLALVAFHQRPQRRPKAREAWWEDGWRRRG
jgi:membrane associated rhomboid family serine protease